MGLRTKFNLVLILSFGIGIGLSGYLAYGLLRDNAREEVLQNARIMVEGALAIRGYTSREIQPLLTLPMKRQFLPQTVSSYAAQTNFRALREHFPEYTYKEAALNPTNLNDRAADWEADIIREFRNNAERKEIITERETPTGRVLTLARPLKVGSPACLTCHSTPDAAPDTMKAVYGTANGFGWQLNEIVGAQVVSIPMAVPLERAEKVFHTFLAGLGAIFLLLLVLLNLLLHFAVIRRVRRIATMADKVSLGEEDIPELDAHGSDEIARLAASFTRMRRSLENAMRLLGE